MRLAIFVDQIFWRDGGVISTNEPYVLFLASFAVAIDEIVLLGREAPESGRAPYVLEQSVISLCSLPYYASLYELWKWDPRVYLHIGGEVRRQAAGRWDALLVCGPHPIGQIVARQCIRLGIPVGLVVRQNLVGLMRAHQGMKRAISVMAAHLLEWDFKRLARGRTVFAVGAEIADAYSRFSRRVHVHFPCLVDDRQLRSFAAMAVPADPTRLVCVGRLAPEKGHQYLLGALVRLKEAGLTCRLDIVGTGALEQSLKSRAAELGIAAQVTFHGHVPYGPALFDLYRQAGVLVLPSLSEGFPQVINESLSVGLPTVATSVGGIPAFLSDGETALLVPPRDAGALATAIGRVVLDSKLREHLRRNGQALMRDNTLEANRARVIGVIRDELLGTPS